MRRHCVCRCLLGKIVYAVVVCNVGEVRLKGRILVPFFVLPFSANPANHDGAMLGAETLRKLEEYRGAQSYCKPLTLLRRLVVSDLLQSVVVQSGTLNLNQVQNAAFTHGASSGECPLLLQVRNIRYE